MNCRYRLYSQILVGIRFNNNQMRSMNGSDAGASGVSSGTGRSGELIKDGYRRYFQIAGITIRLESDLPFKATTFSPKFEAFETSSPGEDTILIRHHFTLPDLTKRDLGKEVYRKAPWAIYEKDGSWIYLGIYPPPRDQVVHRFVEFDRDHSHGEIYNENDKVFSMGGHHALTLFPSDQILLARILPDRDGFYLHSSGVVLDGQGLLFVGHSGAGKSTMIKMLKGRAEILCDDRMIVRRWPDGFKIHGTWSHGEVPEVSSASAPLRAVFFLEKDPENRLTLLKDRKEVFTELTTCLIKPFITSGWINRVLDLIEEIPDRIPCFRLGFNKGGQVVELLERFCASPDPFPGLRR